MFKKGTFVGKKEFWPQYIISQQSIQWELILFMEVGGQDEPDRCFLQLCERV